MLVTFWTLVLVFGIGAAVLAVVVYAVATAAKGVKDSSGGGLGILEILAAAAVLITVVGFIVALIRG